MILYVIIGTLLLFIRPIYEVLGQDAEVAALATKFVHITYPFHFFEVLGNVYNVCYFSNCRIAHYTPISLVTGTVCHAILVYIFCIVNKGGFDGICWATGLMFIIRGMVSYICVKCGGSIPSLPDVYLFSKETVSNLTPVLLIDLKTVAMGVWGFWAFDIFILMASYLGITEVGA